MPGIEPHLDDAAGDVSPPEPRSALFFDGTNFRVARVDADGHIQIDVITTVMDALAATAAHQVTMITALQLIDNLVGALQSVHTDRLKVRGENQLFCIGSVRGERKTAVISGADGFIDSYDCPASAYDVITTIVAQDMTSAVTEIVFALRHDGVNVFIHNEVKAFAIAERSCWSGQTIMDDGDTIRVYCLGGLAGDTIALSLTGYRMTIES